MNPEEKEHYQNARMDAYDHQLANPLWAHLAGLAWMIALGLIASVPVFVILAMLWQFVTGDWRPPEWWMR